MPDPTGADAPTHRVRPARRNDLAHIGPIEDSGDEQYRAWFGPDLHPVLTAPAASGQQRVSRPGYLLVAAAEGRPPVGFAHVLVLDTHAHLEQLSVRPEQQRQGLGSALVRAAMAGADDRGFDHLSLCTYRDVPFNGPFYASLGFVVIEPGDQLPYQRRLRRHEEAIGLDVDGVRVVMDVSLPPKLPVSQRR